MGACPCGAPHVPARAADAPARAGGAGFGRRRLRRAVQPRKEAQREMQDTPETDARRYMPALPAEELVMPVMPGRKDMEAFLLQSKKAALRREYGVH